MLLHCPDVDPGTRLLSRIQTLTGPSICWNLLAGIVQQAFLLGTGVCMLTCFVIPNFPK